MLVKGATGCLWHSRDSILPEVPKNLITYIRCNTIIITSFSRTNVLKFAKWMVRRHAGLLSYQYAGLFTKYGLRLFWTAVVWYKKRVHILQCQLIGSGDVVRQLPLWHHYALKFNTDGHMIKVRFFPVVNNSIHIMTLRLGLRLGIRVTCSLVAINVMYIYIYIYIYMVFQDNWTHCPWRPTSDCQDGTGRHYQSGSLTSYRHCDCTMHTVREYQT